MHQTFPHFIIVTDRGAFRAGWLEPAPAPQQTAPGLSSLKRPANLRRPASVRWVEDLAFVYPRQHLVEQVSDMAGAYSSMESSGGQPRRMPSSPSEVHWRIEADRRSVEDIAEAISRVLEREKPESWSLSAPADIHLALLEAVPAVYRQRLQTVLPKNLAKAGVESIVEHFQSA